MSSESNSICFSKIVVDGREKPRDEQDNDIGLAAERTIARMDKIGFFLIGNGPNLNAQPPDWLFGLTLQLWEKLSFWVEYRQTCVGDKRFYLKGYGKYFKRLAEKAEEYKLDLGC
jgi:hypothetical protein